MADLSRVVAVVIWRASSVLLCKRPLHKRHGGLWEFPGGKLREGETLLDAARRELEEELALRVEALRSAPVAIRDLQSGFSIEFVSGKVSGDPNPLEHAAIAWVKPDRLLTYDLAPADREFVTSHLLKLG